MINLSNSLSRDTGAGKPLRKDAAINRERLLEAAKTVFGTHGVDACVEEVARVAGVGLGTFYRRFPTKEALIDELVRDLTVRMRNLALECLTRSDGSGLEAFLAGAAEVQASNPGYLQRLWNDRISPEVLAELRAILADLLADAQAHGVVRSDIVAMDISVVLWSIRGVIETTRDVAPDAWRRQLEVVLIGLKSSEPALANPPLTRGQADQIGVQR